MLDLDQRQRMLLHERHLVQRGKMIMSEHEMNGNDGLPDFFSHGFTTLEIMLFAVATRAELLVIRADRRLNPEQRESVDVMIRQMDRLYQEHASRVKVSLLGKLDDLVEESGGEDEFMRITQEAGKTTKDVINDLLMLSKVE